MVNGVREQYAGAAKLHKHVYVCYVHVCRMWCQRAAAANECEHVHVL